MYIGRFAFFRVPLYAPSIASYEPVWDLLTDLYKFLAIYLSRNCLSKLGLHVAGMEIVCPNLTTPAGGSVEFDPRIGEQAIYSCHPGLVLVGQGTQLCQANGEWNAEEPICTTPCPNLTDPPNGSVMQTGNEPGSTACYTCMTGFQPTATCRTCLISGEWSGTEITCKGDMSLWKYSNNRRRNLYTSGHFGTGGLGFHSKMF